MERFLRIFKIILLGHAFVFGLVVSFVLGGGVAECVDIPEQPDYRIVLDKITQDMTIQQLIYLFEEHFNCSIETNSRNEGFSNGIWIAHGQNMCSWHKCLIVRSYGDFWDHEYIVYFDSDNKLMGIAEHFPTRRLQCPPWPWEWRPGFAMLPDQSTKSSPQKAGAGYN